MTFENGVPRLKDVPDTPKRLVRREVGAIVLDKSAGFGHLIGSESGSPWVDLSA